MPGVVVYLTFTLMLVGASLLIPSLLVNCTLNSLAKSPPPSPSVVNYP